MNESDFAHCGFQLADLKARLSFDQESTELVRKLYSRVTSLGMGMKVHSIILASQEASKTVSPEQQLPALVGTFITLTEELAAVRAKQVAYVKRFNSNVEYVRALEERCAALSDDLRQHGGDPGQYPEIPKPEA